MQIITKKLASYLMVCVLTMTTLSVPMTASASSYGYMADSEEPSGGMMLADAFLVRPFMLVSTVVTTVTFILTLPFSAAGGNTGESATTLVAEPAAYTFTRPLGKL
ncbi:MAG TPA: hypothetical protein ENK49_13280 [Gammaproteobacteria bacterium]|nr:hypothetical protein [Gammaproteobacteria bacterium]